MSTESEQGDAALSRTRRPYPKKLNVAQIRAVVNAYHSGRTVNEIMLEYRIGRTSLYRYIHEYDRMPSVENDARYWRIEAQRLKDLVVEMAKENKRLNDALQGRAQHAS